MGIASRLQRILPLPFGPDNIVSEDLGLCEFSIDLDLHTDNLISSLSERYTIDRPSVFVGAIDLFYTAQFKHGCFIGIGNETYDTAHSLLGPRRSALEAMKGVHVLPQHSVRVSFMLPRRCAGFVDRTFRHYAFGDSKTFCRDAVHLYSSLALKADEGSDVFVYGKRSLPMRWLLGENYGERFTPAMLLR